MLTSPDSLRLEYQVGPDGPWVPVAIDMPVMGATTSAREATWVPEARSVPISIRAEVSDFAGNITKTQRTVSGVIPKTDPAAATVNDNVAQWPGERTQGTPLNGCRPADHGRQLPPQNRRRKSRWPAARVRTAPLPKTSGPVCYLARKRPYHCRAANPFLRSPRPNEGCRFQDNRKRLAYRRRSTKRGKGLHERAVI